MKRSSSNRPCPCKSGAPYRECCKPFHDGAEPPDPERVMRSPLPHASDHGKES